jgi:ribonuclease-3
VINALPGIDYRFKDAGLLQQALTHRSAGRANYERLEFLGDSILNLVVSTRLFELFPGAPEGDLSRMRARIVRGKTLGEIALTLDLGRHLNLGEGEMKSGGFRRASILADGGYAACCKVIVDLCDPLIGKLPPAEELKDSKTRLQEWLQARARPLPTYRLLREEGAEHAKNFHVQCGLEDSDVMIVASGSSRRKAEQSAAGELLKTLTGRKSD